jgi:hypothetical protein
MTSITLDNETADRIAVCVMKEHLELLKDDLRQHADEDRFMHPEDLIKTERELIPALETLIKYFGR